MPQISKVRIVNFNYNDGKRLIADELFDFADKDGIVALNSLINLKNGGGKSVLVQLMLQPIHPKAKVAGRKIESFFTKASDHCFIAIEWFKDNSKEKLMTGIAMASGESSGGTESEAKGRPIKYYTFMSNYSDYNSKFNIIELPLSRKEKSGFIAASFNEVRELAKKSNGDLNYYTSDESRYWREKIAEYGIVQEEWKSIIEELNSVEGGMSEFFAGFKESDQLIDQLLIPTIEGKFGKYSVKEEDITLSTMFIEHAKAYNRQKDLINEMESCKRFQGLLVQINEMVQAVWNRKDDYDKKLQEFAGFFCALNEKKKILQEKIISLEDAMKKEQEELIHIDHEKCSEEYYTTRDNYETVKSKCIEIEKELKNTEDAINDINHKLNVLSCAKLYTEISVYENQMKAIQAEIKFKTENSDSVQMLNNIGFSVMQLVNILYPKVKNEQETLKNELVGFNEILVEVRNKLEESQDKENMLKSRYDQLEGVYKYACEQTDRMIQKLDINAVRYLDGCYQMSDIQKEKISREKDRQKLESEISKRKDESEKLVVRNENIDTDYLKCYEKNLKLESDKERLEAELDQYTELENSTRDIISLYNLTDEAMFNGQLLQEISAQETMNVAKRESLATKISIIKEEIQAAEHGYVHVPKRVIEYLNYAGIHYQTCEKYLNSIIGSQITKEQCLEILKNYPAIAYGIILDEVEKKKLVSIEREMEDWLPSMVPVFTHEQFERALSIKEHKGGAIAFYSIEYFASKESFIEELQVKQQELESQKEELIYKIESNAVHKKKAEAIAEYNSNSASEYKVKIENNSKELGKIADRIKNLLSDTAENEEKIKKLENEVNAFKTQFDEIERWLEKFDELETSLKTETAKRNEKSEAYQTYVRAQVGVKEQRESLTKIEGNIELTKDLLKGKNTLVSELEEVKTEIGEIQEGTQIEGKWNDLFTEYRELKKSKNTEVTLLYEREKNCLERISEKKEAINKFDLLESDYIEVVFEDTVFENLSKKKGNIAEKQKELQNKVNTVQKELGKCEAAFEAAENALSEYNGVLLEENDIKGDYKERKDETKRKLEALKERNKEENSIQNEVSRLIDRTQYILDRHKKINPEKESKLEDDLTVQFGKLSEDLKDTYNNYCSENRKLADLLQKESMKEYDYKMNEIQALKSFESMANNTEFKGDKYYTLSEQIEGVIKATELRYSQIETDLEEFNRSKSDLLRQCVFQGRRIYDGLRSMAKSSLTSIIEGKPKKQMIRIDIPDEIDINVAEAAIDSELNTGIQEVVELLNRQSSEVDIKRTANRVIGSRSLLRKYVGKDNIRVDVYKIDLNPENAKYRTWKETQINSSGGEKLVSYFALILSLLNYTRSDFEDINDKNLTSVLILDNPFGAISSGHLLKPMFEIADHFRVQLICLSDLNKADITACFDNFIKAVVKPLNYSTVELLTHDGNELIEHGFYKSEQMTLFV